MSQPRSSDAEIAELIYELRQAWFGRVEPKLSAGTRAAVGFVGSFSVLTIMVYLTLITGGQDAQSSLFEALWIYILAPVPL